MKHTSNPYYDRGLFECQVCGAAEGASTTECPGHKVSSAIWMVVYEGELDFKYLNGMAQWVEETSPFCPKAQRIIQEGVCATDGKPLTSEHVREHLER